MKMLVSANKAFVKLVSPIANALSAPLVDASDCVIGVSHKFSPPKEKGAFI